MKKPKGVHRLAEACLKALQETGLGKHLVLAGAFALAHYHQYRGTKDVDAWWRSDVTSDIRRDVVQTLTQILEEFGHVSVREFGDVVSLDFIEENITSFSFQIAHRSAQLNPVLASPWEPVMLDSLEDLVASKVTALVQRGLPRDFIDVFEICQKSLATVDKCWRLWQAREKKRGVDDPSLALASKALELHLKRIEQMRPLQSIVDRTQREKAHQLRSWFKKEFIGGTQVD